MAAIKHTHHALDARDRGDTALFRREGANPVILAGDGDSIRFEGDATTRLSYDTPQDLLRNLEAELGVRTAEGISERIVEEPGAANATGRAGLVLIEGFSSFTGWPRIELDLARRMSAAEARSILDRIWQQGP